MEGFFNQFLDNIKQVVADAVREILEQIKQESCEQWVDRTEIAEHLGQSPSWVSDHLHMMPHVKHDKAVKFKKSDVDAWRIETFGRHYNRLEKQPKIGTTKSSIKGKWKPIE